MALHRSAERIEREVAHLCQAGLSPLALLDHAFRALQPALPADAWMGATTDPATLLYTGALTHAMPADGRTLLVRNEFLEDDCLKIATLARARGPVEALSA